MSSPEVNRSSEIPQERFDALIVLGENIKQGWGPKEIRQQTDNLSPYSRANVVATIILSLSGITNRLIFSTGYTSGKGLLSEAKAMQALYDRLMQSIKQPNAIPLPEIILEEDSLNTSGNAKKVSKIIKENKWNTNNIGLLAPSFHIKGM